jgi:hypothetical protein
LFKITLPILFPTYKKLNCTISLKFLSIKYGLQNKRYLRNFLEHMGTSLKCYLDCLWLYKNKILEKLLSGNIMDSLMVEQLFLVEFSRHLVLQLRGSSLVSQLLTWITSICMEGSMESCWLQGFFYADNGISPLAYSLVEEHNINWRWFSLLIQHHITSDCSGICIISDKHDGRPRLFDGKWFPENHFSNFPVFVCH